MKLGLLETGAPPAELAKGFGDYPGMFRKLLGPDAFNYQTFDVAGGVLPSSVDACEAYIVTGSSAGVYDPLPWIAPLQDFLVQARGRAALVGICFGHQVMAQAFGGQVIKSPKGWGVGLHRYQIARRRNWMDDRAGVVAMPASHQDQVVMVPPGAEVVGASAFTPFGMLDYGARAISVQLHPEFEPAYAKALIEARRGARLSEAQADEAIASYEAADDRARVGDWIKRFLEQNPI